MWLGMQIRHLWSKSLQEKNYVANTIYLLTGISVAIKRFVFVKRILVQKEKNMDFFKSMDFCFSPLMVEGLWANDFVIMR